MEQSAHAAAGPDTSSGSAVRIGHSLVQTIRDPVCSSASAVTLEQRTVSEGRSTSLVPGRIYEVTVSPMPGGGAVAVLHDITRIEQVERTQRDFVANVSHELRTPLTSISGYVETLLDHEASLSQEAREFLYDHPQERNPNESSDRGPPRHGASRIIRTGAAPVPIPADVLVREAVQAMSGLVQDTEAVLQIGEITTAEVVADTDAILQVLSNLIENGIKYGKARNEPNCRRSSSAREISEPIEAVEFSVRDFGPGIASEHLNRIFERFYRVDKARSRESGGQGWDSRSRTYGPDTRRIHSCRKRAKRRQHVPIHFAKGFISRISYGIMPFSSPCNLSVTIRPQTKR